MTDEPVRVAVAVTVEDDRVVFDLTGSADQRPSSINTTSGGALSACAYALRCQIDPDIPVNDGFYRAIDVRTRQGSHLRPDVGPRRSAAGRTRSGG